MARYYYNEETGELIEIESESEKFNSALAGLFIIAAPFVIIACILRKYAEFVSSHSTLSTVIFVILSLIIGVLVYSGQDDASFKPVGIAAVVVSLLPIGIAQTGYIIPYILSTESALDIFFEWLIITVITVLISIFINAMCMMSKNGIIHFIAAAVYFIITVAMVG